MHVFRNDLNYVLSSLSALLSVMKTAIVAMKTMRFK